METNKAEETPLKKMNSDRIKEIQETTSCPNSTSVQQALLQVWNECSQQSQSEIDELTNDLKSCQDTADFWERKADEAYKEIEELIESKQSYCQQYEDKCKEVERLRKDRESFIEIMKAHRLNAIENQQQGIRNQYHSGAEETIDYLITIISYP